MNHKLLALALSAAVVSGCASKQPAPVEVAPEPEPEPVAVVAPEPEPIPEPTPPPAPQITVHYDFDSAELKAESVQALQEVLDYIKEVKGVDIIVSGHTDSLGPDQYNAELAKKRAAAVVDYLKQNGFTDVKFDVESYGESQPVSDNSTKEGRQQNRRAEIKVETTTSI